MMLSLTAIAGLFAVVTYLGYHALADQDIDDVDQFWAEDWDDD